MIKGENLTIPKRFKDKNNIDLPIANIEAKVRLNNVEYILGIGNNLRSGSVANELIFEITEEISNTLPLGNLTIEWEVRVPNAGFVIDPKQIDIFRETLKVE